jgi:hypothetical protein
MVYWDPTTYLASRGARRSTRQLYSIKNGARVLKGIVGDRTDEDIIAIAAYVGSRGPSCKSPCPHDVRAESAEVRERRSHCQFATHTFIRRPIVTVLADRAHRQQNCPRKARPQPLRKQVGTRRFELVPGAASHCAVIQPKTSEIRLRRNRDFSVRIPSLISSSCAGVAEVSSKTGLPGIISTVIQRPCGIC